MFQVTTPTLSPDYPSLIAQLKSLFAGERDFIANAAQFSAFVYQTIDGLNWAGFYLYRDQQLVLGPFQGKVACVRIPLGRGVCGTSAERRETIVVADVHSFPGHIACDSASNAEIVMPVISDGALIGVFDIDSPLTNRFTETDRQGLELMLATFIAATDFTSFK